MNEETVYRDNLRLNRIEYLRQHIYLRSQPRCLGIVLGNSCNLQCIHCYQAKNGDNLLRPAEIGRELRREFMGVYPYLSTLRVQGGEVFALAGFRELLDDVSSSVSRPILSVSTNGTLIDEEWAERIVRTPFLHVTFSIDGATAGTFDRIRRGAHLDSVLANVRRLQTWKNRLGSELPHLDAFFVIMRSNYREIPRFLDLMRDAGISEVALQTVQINLENASRTPGLAGEEAITESGEVAELHGILHSALARERGRFRMIRVSGLRSLFAEHGLDGSFLLEEVQGLYPESDGLAPEPRAADAETAGPGFDLCPNPWTTLFISEDGSVFLCFLSDPIGNLYENPLAGLWNCPKAVAKRSDMVAGRYLASGCSEPWCSWREGIRCPAGASTDPRILLAEMKQVTARALRLQPPEEGAPPPAALDAVRRLLRSRERRIAELESMFRQLCDENRSFHEAGRRQIDRLESEVRHLEELLEKGQQHIDHLETKARKAVADFNRLHEEFLRFREPPLVRAANKVSRAWAKLRPHRP